MLNRNNRDDFHVPVIRELANRVNWHCSKPDCQAPTRARHTQKDKAVNLGVAAHITAAAPNGPRYDQNLTSAQRADIGNAIWLCKSCSDLIDKDEIAYPVALLRDWKEQAEARAEVQIGKPLSRTEAQWQQLMDSNARLTEAFTRLSLQIPIAPPTTNLKEQRLAVDVDRIIKWSESGDTNKIASAMVVIGEVRDDAEFGQVSLEMQARVATVAALCASSTSDDGTAAREVELALTLNPNNAVCLSNAAGLALMEDKFERAIELALRVRDLAPDNENAMLVLVQAWHRLGQKEKVEKFLRDNPSYFELPHGLSVLAHVRRREGNYDEAIRLTKRALKRNRENVQALEELFDVLFFPIRGESCLKSGWDFGPQTRRRLRSAEAAVTRAITILEKGPNKRKLHQALSNRASARSARGKIAEALEDCDRVLLSDPTPENRDTVSLNKAMILNRGGRSVEGIPLLESLQDERRREEGAFLLACCYQIAGQNEKALEIWERIWQPQKEDGAEMVTAEMLLSEYRRQGNKEAAENVLRQAKETWSGRPEFVALSAQDAFEQGDFDRATSLLREAAQIYQQRHDEVGQVRTLTRLGYTCYLAQRFEEAASSWGEVEWSRLLPPYRTAFLNALYHCRQLAKALQIIKLIKEEDGFNARVQEIEAGIYAYNGDARQARLLLEELVRREPHNPLHAINLAVIALQSDDEVAAHQALQSVSYGSIKNDADSLRRVSSMQSHLGFKEAIRFAFRARQIDFGNPESHNNYVQVFLDSTNAHSLDENGAGSKTHAADVLGLNGPKWGEVPCTIRLQPVDSENKEERRDITILSDVPFDHTHDIYGAHEDFARRLLDYSRSREGTFLIRRGPGLPAREYRITEVLSPYVHAFQESPVKSAEWFGEGASMWSINVEQGFDQFFAFMDEWGQAFDRAMGEYEEWRFPLCCVASRSNRSVFDLWFWAARLPKWGIHSELGATEAFEGSIETLKTYSHAPRRDAPQGDNSPQEKPVLVLDSTALLLLVHLELGEVLLPHFRFFVPASLRRRLQHEETKFQLPHIPPGIFTRLLEWVDAHAEVLPVTSLLSFSPSDIEKWRSVLGQEELDVLLLAREHGALMLCEDALLRQLAQWEIEIKVSSVNAQHVLLLLTRSSLLSEEEHFNCLERMVKGNVRHLLLPAAFFSWLLKKHDYANNETTRAAFHYLQAPMCRAEGAVLIVAMTLSRVARFAPDKLEKTLDLCLLPLMMGHPIKATLTRLQAALGVFWPGSRANPRLLPLLLFDIGECKTRLTADFKQES